MKPGHLDEGGVAVWEQSSLDALIQHIVEHHHTYLRRELPLMELTIKRATGLRGRGDASTLGPLIRIFRYFRRELELHLRKEEEVLFPLIRRLETAFQTGDKLPRFRFGPLANPIGIMEEDHAAEKRQLERMLALAGNYTGPADVAVLYGSLFERIRAVDADMHRHVHLENEILFRRVTDMESALW